MIVEWSQFAQWMFYGIIAFCAYGAVDILKGMKTSIDNLNVNVATLLERTASHEKRIENLESKID